MAARKHRRRNTAGIGNTVIPIKSFLPERVSLRMQARGACEPERKRPEKIFVYSSASEPKRIDFQTASTFSCHNSDMLKRFMPLKPLGAILFLDNFKNYSLSL